MKKEEKEKPSVAEKKEKDKTSVAEKNEKEKSKEFFNKIVGMNNANQNIKVESQKRLNRDF